MYQEKKIKEIHLIGGNSFHYKQSNLGKIIELIKTLKDDEGYTVSIQYLINE